MSATRFTEGARAGLVARLEAGVPLSDAARAEGLPVDTVRSWLRRGRWEGAGRVCGLRGGGGAGAGEGAFGAPSGAVRVRRVGAAVRGCAQRLRQRDGRTAGEITARGALGWRSGRLIWGMRWTSWRRVARPFAGGAGLSLAHGCAARAAWRPTRLTGHHPPVGGGSDVVRAACGCLMTWSGTASSARRSGSASPRPRRSRRSGLA